MERKSPVDLSTVKVISDSFFYSAARVVILVLKPIKGILLGRLLGPALYGILNIPNPYVLIGAMLSNIGFNTSVLKLMPGYLQEGRPDLARMIYRSTAFCTIVLSALWASVMLVFSPWIAEHVAHETAAVNPLRLYALAIPFLALNTFFASVYLGVQRGKLGASISFAYGLLNNFLPVAAVLWQRNVTLIVGAILAAELAGAVLYAFFFHRRVLPAFGAAIGPLWRGIKETTRFGFLFFIAGLGWNLINSVDRIMIKFYLPAEQLGYYSMGAQVITVLNIVASTLGFALVPSLTAAKDDPDRTIFGKLVRNASRFGFIVLMPITFVSFALVKDFFGILVPRFDPSTTIVQIVISITFIDLFCRIGWAALVAHGRGGLSAVAYVAAALVNIALNAALIPRYGINGAAVAVLATFLVLAATILIMMKRVTGSVISPATWIHPLLISIVYVILARVAAGWGAAARIVLVMAGGTVLYAAAALATGLVRSDDLAKIRGMLEPRAAVPHVRFAIAALDFVERIMQIVKLKRN